MSPAFRPSPHTLRIPHLTLSTPAQPWVCLECGPAKPAVLSARPPMPNIVGDSEEHCLFRFDTDLSRRQVWRSKTRDYALRTQVTADEESPFPRFPLQLPAVPNLNRWYPSFDVNIPSIARTSLPLRSFLLLYCPNPLCVPPTLARAGLSILLHSEILARSAPSPQFRTAANSRIVPPSYPPRIPKVLDP